jgi:5-methylcytosine-specific restriction endonuclease McrA
MNHFVESEFMSANKTQSDDLKQRQFIVEARREQELRMKGYREQALKLFPPICGRCGREFEGKRLRELTVHHKDHDHDNNPPDGSNWELLCIYCHDNEHSRNIVADWSDEPIPGEEQTPVSTYNPFAGLDTLLKKKK